jgi:hypothetical protein
LAGIIVGAVGAGAYWLAAELWPTSVALVASLLAMLTITDLVWVRESGADTGRRGGGNALYWVFVVLFKYNALMALSSAHIPFAVPGQLTLGLIIIAGQAAASALVVSVMANALREPRLTTLDLAVALLLGLVPATLLGVPGLVGLGAAIAMRFALTVQVLPRFKLEFRESLAVIQQLTELSFYLGALATWTYI